MFGGSGQFASEALVAEDVDSEHYISGEIGLNGVEFEHAWLVELIDLMSTNLRTRTEQTEQRKLPLRNGTI